MTEEFLKSILNHPSLKIRKSESVVPTWGEVLNFGRVMDKSDVQNNLLLSTSSLEISLPKKKGHLEIQENRLS